MLLQQGAARPLIIADLALTARLENPAWDIHFVSWVETDKNLETVAALAQTLQQFQSRKHKGLNSIVAIGGGLLLDLVGFAAGLLGLKVTYVPTTVLAMIDAGIGGKTAVNHPTYGKNQLGLFCQPQEVILDCSFLSSLPARQWNAGLVEGIKHALLMRDEPMLAALWRMKPNSEALKPWLLPILNVKAKIVEKDPWELGERAVLNLGHTIGHALENFSEHKFLHGEAVLIGLIVDVHFSHQQGGLDQKQLQSTLADLRQVVAESLGPMTSNHKAFFLELLSLFSNPGRWKATLGPLLAQDKKKLLVDDHEIPMIQLDWVNSPATNRITHALVTRVPFAALDIPLKESAHFLNSVLFQPS
jgi:3-dehydroquinate synthetase